VALERLLDQYDTELRVAFRHLPLSQHKGADRAAEVAAATMALSGPAAFWKMFETLTEHQSRQDDDQLLTWAEEAGSDRTKLKTALDAGTYTRVVEQDRSVARRLMVRDTPTFFINGRRLNGMQSQSILVDEVEQERSAARAALGSGTKPPMLYHARVLFNVTAGAADRRRPRSP
jgi:predicted DsbA family dithiol-disulfide isomerase